MDGVGARLGRSSNMYAPTTTVFTGPVRRWKKKWIHGTPPSFGNCNRPTDNGGVNGNNDSHLLLFKWTPITSSQNRNETANSSAKDDGFIAEEPPKRKFNFWNKGEEAKAELDAKIKKFTEDAIKFKMDDTADLFDFGVEFLTLHIGLEH